MGHLNELQTSHHRKCGMAYRMKVPRSRSSHSTQTIGATPNTGGRGTGGWEREKGEGAECVHTSACIRCHLLESRMHGNVQVAVRGGAVGNVPEKATRWLPTLR
jgi:hypothetical protein